MLPNQRWYCSIHQTLVSSGAFCSTYFIVFMTFERFYSIIRPHKAASFNTVKRARIIIICVVVMGFSFYTPLWFISDNVGRYCIISKDIVHSFYGSVSHWLSLFISFVLPIVSLMGMNTVIIHTLRKRSQWIISRPQGHDQSQGQIQGQSSMSSERQIYITLLLVTFTFLALSIPICSLIFWDKFSPGTTPYFYASFHLFYNVGEKTYYTNNGINFFLYVMSGQKFRTDLVQLFRCKCQNPPPDGSVSVTVNNVTSSVPSKWTRTKQIT